MAGAGLDRIPLRIPAEWDAAWFETFVRDVLAQADVRNAVEGTGISIAGTPDGPATLAASQDVLNLLNASLLTVTASNLTQGRQLIVEPGVLELTDAGPGSTALLAIAAHGVPLSKLSHIAPYSVLGDDTGAGVAVEIPASSNDTLLGRRSDVLGFGPLTLDMIPDELITYAKLQNATALSVLGRAGNTDGELDEIVAANDHEILRRSGTSIGFGSIDLSQSGAVGSSRLALSNIAQITGQAVLGVASAGAGNLAAISAGTNDRLLRQTGGSLNFGQLTSGMFPNTVVPDAALSSNVALLNAANTWTGVTRIAANTASATTPPLRVGTTGTTNANAHISVVVNTSAVFALFNDADDVETQLISGTASGIFGVRTNHPFEIRTNNVTRVTIPTYNAIRIAATAGDPASPSDGDIWYNSITGKFRGRAAGASVDLH